jgi:hypothetical protein
MVSQATGSLSTDPQPSEKRPSDTIEPWSQPPTDTLSPEELSTPTPSCFNGLLAYLSKPYGDFYPQNVLDLIDEKVEPAFMKELRTLMHSELFRRRFAREKWIGHVGIPPLHLDTTESLPSTLRSRARTVNPLLHEAFFLKKLNSLCSYFYRPSTSPYASRQESFLSFHSHCYRLPPSQQLHQEVIPDVAHSLEKARVAECTVELYLTSSFHQIKLDAVATPLGLLELIFAPDGASPMSAILQSIVNIIFGNFSDWLIFIFDNLLILCADCR